MFIVQDIDRVGSRCTVRNDQHSHYSKTSNRTKFALKYTHSHSVFKDIQSLIDQEIQAHILPYSTFCYHSTQFELSNVAHTQIGKNFTAVPLLLELIISAYH